MVYCWMYISRATTPEGSLDDVAIYLEARERNRDFRVTGFLHRESDHYAQYIEGDTDSISQLRSIITQDPRHTDLRVLAQGVVERRLFEGWDMAYSSGSGISFADFHGTDPVTGNLSDASLAEILYYMKAAIADGHAVSVASRLPDLRCL